MPRFRTPVWVLAVAVLVPVAVFAAILAWTEISEVRSLTDQHYATAARSLQAAIDNHLRGQLKTLQQVAASAALQSGDLAAFREQARRLVAPGEEWDVVVLCGPDGHRPLLSTGDAVLAPPAPSAAPAAALLSKAQIDPALSDEWTPGHPAIVLRAPVFRGGNLIYVVSAALSPSGIAAILKNAPADSRVSVLDRQFRLVTGWDLADMVAGQVEDGQFLGFSSSATDPVSGQDTFLRIVTASPLTGWHIAIGSRFHFLHKRIYRLSAWLTAGAMVALLAALSGASSLGWAIGKSLRAAERRTAARRLRTARQEVLAAQAESHALAKEIEALETRLQSASEAVPATIWLPRDGIPAQDAAAPSEELPDETDADEHRQLAVELQLVQRELAAAKTEAELADAAKSRFLAAASHDLRQPFQAMNLYLQVLESMNLGAKAQTALDLLRNSMTAGEELLKALLDISAFEAGMVVSNVTVFPVAEILEELAAEYRNLATERGLTFRTFPVDALVETDRILAKRMCRNLVHNAFRYTQRGGILVGCRRRGQRILIQVYDTGPGIPADKLQMIFEDFYQLDNPSRDKTKGLGLGLSIVQRTAHLLGQDVWVASRLDHGSVFSITLPLAMSPDPESDAQADPARPGG